MYINDKLLTSWFLSYRPMFPKPHTYSSWLHIHSTVLAETLLLTIVHELLTYNGCARHCTVLPKLKLIKLRIPVQLSVKFTCTSIRNNAVF